MLKYLHVLSVQNSDKGRGLIAVVDVMKGIQPDNILSSNIHENVVDRESFFIYQIGVGHHFLGQRSVPSLSIGIRYCGISSAKIHVYCAHKS